MSADHARLVAGAPQLLSADLASRGFEKRDGGYMHDKGSCAPVVLVL